MQDARLFLRSLLALSAPVAVAVALTACGDDGDDKPPPPPPKVTRVHYDLADPCAAQLPTPTDLFFDGDGASALAACPLPADPQEAALADALRHQGPRPDARLSVPFEGSLDETTLSSTAAFSLTATTSPSGAPLPPVLLLAQVGTASSAAGWELIPATMAREEGALTIRPSRSLAPGVFHVAVLTRAIRDDERPQKPLGAAPAVEALLGAEPIAAGAYEGLGADAAVRLERLRLRLAPLVPLLARGRPALQAGDVVSIQGFTVEAGFGRFTRLVSDYQRTLDDARYAARGETEILPLEQVYAGVPPAAYERVREFRRGTITAPKLLGEDGRLRPGWNRTTETLTIPFTISLPRDRDSGYPVVLFIPGFGRGSIDGRSLAQVFASAPQAAVLTIDLRCHGARSPGSDGICAENRTPDQVAQLADTRPNNGNPEVRGADGIPDASGIGFFPTDARALRDSQMAAAIEIMHVLEALRAEGIAGISPDRSELHLIAQGHAAPAAVAALAFSRAVVRTLQLPSAGAGVGALILDGPAELKSAFLQALPHGLGEAQAQAYLARVERDVFSAFDLRELGRLAAAKLTAQGAVRRALLPHPAMPEFVSLEARQSLVAALGLPNDRISRHNARCSDFLIFTCQLGQNPAILEAARGQLVTFMLTRGNTVTEPAR